MADLSPWEIAAYDTRRAAAKAQHMGDLALINYRKSMLGIQNQFDTDSLNRQWFDYRQQLPGSYNARGLLNSGIYKNALSKYATERQSSFDQLRFNYQRQIGEQDLEYQKSYNIYEQTHLGVDAEQAARRAQLASQLQAVM